ncbi:MAG: transporter [Mycobacterium sp.]
MSNAALIATLAVAAVLVVLIVVVFRSMMRGWMKRAEIQGPAIGSLPPLPETVGPALTPEMSGLYVGSTFLPDRLARVVARGLGDQTKAVLTRYPEGIMLKRIGGRPLWIPDEAIVAIRTERVAGKEAAEDGILAIRWRLPSGTEVDTGFRGDDLGNYADWLGGAEVE